MLNQSLPQINCDRCSFSDLQLLSKINEVQQDKEKLAIDLEREEECLTNKLQRQLRQVGIEKSETDAEIDDLKRQLEDMKSEREKVSKILNLNQSDCHNCF